MKQYMHILFYAAFWASLILLPVLLGAQGISPDAPPVIECSTMQVDSALRLAHPELGTLEDFEAWLAPHVQRYQDEVEDRGGTVLDTHYISIVFHVIHDGEDVGTGANVSDATILFQFLQLYADYNPRRFQSLFGCPSTGVNTEIIFCTPAADPDGKLISGALAINRINRNDKNWSAPPYGDSYIDNTIKPATIWDPKNYLNVWILDLDGTLLGYGTFPSIEFSGIEGVQQSATSTTDGVVVDFTAVAICVANVAVGGRTLTHEVGHYLGLRHIWGDGDCNLDDYCNDTPRASASNSGCNTNANSCDDTNYGSTTDPNDMVQNHMDYSNHSCRDRFTDCQKMRMKAVLKYSSSRKTLSRWPCLSCSNNISLAVNNAPVTPEFRQSGAWIHSTDVVQATASTPTGPMPREVFYKAGDYVLLQDGFRANDGSLFIASTAPCWKAPGTVGPEPKEGIPVAPHPEDAEQALLEMPELQLRVLPNPFRDEFVVVVDVAEPADNLRIQLFDTNGRVVAGGGNSIAPNGYVFNVQHLPAGLYFLQVNAGAYIQTEKLVKQW